MPRVPLHHVILWSLLAAATPTSAAELREWSDESGRFGLTANFVRRNDFGIVIRDASGGDRHLLWDLISRRDQEYVDAAVAADPKLKVTCPQAKAFLAFVAEGNEGQNAFGDGAPGFVFQAAGDRTSVLVARDIEDPLKARRVKPEDIRYRTTTVGPEAPREVSLRKSPVQFYDQRILLSGARSELPEPISSETRLNAKEGDVLYLIHYRFDRRATPVTFERKVEPVVVERLYRYPDGTTAGFQIVTPEERVIDSGIVVADDGSTFATVKPSIRSEDRQAEGNVRKSAYRYFDCEGPTHQWASLPVIASFHQIGSRAEATPTGWKIEILVAVGEPLGKTTGVTMLIEPGLLMGQHQNMFVVADGRWKNASSQGKELELKKVDSFDPALVEGPVKTPRADHSYWLGTTTIDLPKTGQQAITFDFTSRDEAGNVRLRRRAVNWKLEEKNGPFYQVSEPIRSGPELPLLKPKQPAVK